MKFKIAVVLGLACLIAVCSARPAEDYDYDDAGAAPAKPASRSNPLLNRRNPLSRGAGGKSTTTTTPPPAEEEEEELPEEELAEEEALAETSSTTESSRKLKAGVRPFRSNEDLLATLKKRREQAASNKAAAKANGQDAQESAPVASESEKPSKGRPPSSGGRGRFSKKENANAPHAEEEQGSTTAASRTSGRRFRN